MPENIKLQQVMVDRVIVKMCRDNVCRHIIRRMLHRCEGIDILPVRQYDDSSRMLPGAPPDPGTPFHDPLNFTLPLSASMLLIVIFYKSERRLLRQRSDRPGAVRLPFSEDDLGILMCITLISPEKFKSISGSLFPLNPRNVSNGISNPSLTSGCPQFGHTLSGISHPHPPANARTSSDSKSL